MAGLGFDGGCRSRGDASVAAAAASEPVCGYAAGTLIDTPGGARPVEAIVAGDRVETLDHGPMVVRWVHTETQAFAGLPEAARPVLIAAGAFGPDCPKRDLVVAPGHRILVGALGQIDGTFGGQCFAPARALTRLRCIRPMMGRAEIRWSHFVLDRHEVVRANGCYSESLRLSRSILDGLKPFKRRRLEQAFRLRQAPMTLPARDCLSELETQAGLARYRRSGMAAKVA
ncbi:MAG: Hint domain-containing protein [Rhodobacter sp.]|nr:Hint domain-containing protein [Rhodobacter sp.]